MPDTGKAAVGIQPHAEIVFVPAELECHFAYLDKVYGKYRVGYIFGHIPIQPCGRRGGYFADNIRRYKHIFTVVNAVIGIVNVIIAVFVLFGNVKINGDFALVNKGKVLCRVIQPVFCEQLGIQLLCIAVLADTAGNNAVALERSDALHEISEVCHIEVGEIAPLRDQALRIDKPPHPGKRIRGLRIDPACGYMDLVHHNIAVFHLRDIKADTNILHGVFGFEFKRITLYCLILLRRGKRFADLFVIHSVVRNGEV